MCGIVKTFLAMARRFLESTDRPYIEKPINLQEVRGLVLRLLEEG